MVYILTPGKEKKFVHVIHAHLTPLSNKFNPTVKVRLCKKLNVTTM